MIHSGINVLQQQVDVIDRAGESQYADIMVPFQPVEGIQQEVCYHKRSYSGVFDGV